jgi:hypothetical protein
MCGQCTHENEHFMKYATFIKPPLVTGRKKPRKVNLKKLVVSATSDSDSLPEIKEPVVVLPYKYSLTSYFRDLSHFSTSVPSVATYSPSLVFLSIFTNSVDSSSYFLQLIQHWNEQDKNILLERYFVFRIFAFEERSEVEKACSQVMWDTIHSLILQILSSGDDDRSGGWFISFSVNDCKWKESLLQENRRIKIVLFADDLSVIKYIINYSNPIHSHLIDYRIICTSDSLDVGMEEDLRQGSVYFVFDEEAYGADEVQRVFEFIN